MDVGNGEVRPPEKSFPLVAVINPIFSLCWGAAGCHILSEAMWYIRVYVSPASALWGDFFSSRDDADDACAVRVYQCGLTCIRV